MASKHILHFFIVKHDRACASNRRMCGTMKAKRGFKHPLFYFFNPSIICTCPGKDCSFCEQKEPKKLQSASLRDALAVPAQLGWAGFSAGALIMGENPTRAAPENHSPTNEAEITRGRPMGTTSAKVLWVPFLQKRYGSMRVGTNKRTVTDNRQRSPTAGDRNANGHSTPPAKESPPAGTNR